MMKNVMHSYLVGALLLLLVFLLPSEPVNAVPIELHGLNYNTRQGPDWDWNKCKDSSQALTDLTLLKRMTNRIRILSLTDCDQGTLVGSVARELGMQLWLGMWVAPEAWVFEEEKGALQNLINQGVFDDNTVLGITVGSEAIYREDATAAEMIGYMNEVYVMLQTAGITDVPVTIVDVAPVYNVSPELRAAVNVTMTNTFPFWEGIPIAGAVDDLQQDLEWLLNLPESQGKPFILGETGWPSDGFVEDVGIAGPDLQRRYFEEAYCRMHVENQWAYYWFTGIDNDWRQEQDPENTIEGNWGFFYANLTLKEHFQDLAFSCSDGVTYSFAELDVTIPSQFTPAPVTLDVASCQAHSGCTELFGNCCPNDSGDFLGCCGDGASLPPAPTTMPVLPPTPNPTSSVPTTATTTTMTSSAPTQSPTFTSSLTTPTTAPEASVNPPPSNTPTITQTLNVPASAAPTIGSTPGPVDLSSPPTPSPTTTPTTTTTVTVVPTIAPNSNTNTATEALPTSSPTSQIPVTPKPTVADESFRVRPTRAPDVASSSTAATSSGATSMTDSPGQLSMCFVFVTSSFFSFFV